MNGFLIILLPEFNEKKDGMVPEIGYEHTIVWNLYGQWHSEDTLVRLFFVSFCCGSISVFFFMEWRCFRFIKCLSKRYKKSEWCVKNSSFNICKIPKVWELRNQYIEREYLLEGNLRCEWYKRWKYIVNMISSRDWTWEFVKEIV